MRRWRGLHSPQLALLNGAIAPVLFGVGKLLYDARAGLWTALAYITVAAVSYSSGLMSTDVPLLFFLSVALYAFIRAMREENKASYGWAALCGAAIDFGLLSKYATLYFVLGMALSPLISAEARRLILSLQGILVAFIAVAIFVPNILWNTSHGFATVAHTAANADWQRGGVHLAGALEFLVGQFGVFRPLMMAVYLYALWRVLLREDPSPTGLPAGLVLLGRPCHHRGPGSHCQCQRQLGGGGLCGGDTPPRGHADGRGKGLGAHDLACAQQPRHGRADGLRGLAPSLRFRGIRQCL
jgi:4-amino-4-deoxy-L-arabinose transferase-like glycosyltransferase